MAETPAPPRDETSARLVRWVPPWAPETPPLWVRGRPPQGLGVAVVGARASDPYGLAVAARSATAAVSLDHVVVRGGAEGCDRAAHEATMEAGGITVVVLAGGLDRPYPAAHRPLFDAVVASGGAILSPHGPGTPPRPHRFLERNRTIAALSAVVVVARARGRSGALSTAREAFRLGRPVLAVPGPVGCDLSVGAHELLARGALPMTGPRALARATRVRDRGGEPWPITDEMVPAPFHDPLEEFFDAPVTVPPEGEALLEALRAHQVLDLAGLSRLTRLPTNMVMALLVELEIAGCVTETSGRYRPTAAVSATSTSRSTTSRSPH